MADPLFLARLLAAAAMAAILCLCASNAKGHELPAGSHSGTSLAAR